MYAPTAVGEYQAFVYDDMDVLQKVRSTGISTHTLEQTVKHGKAQLLGMKTQRLTRTAGIYCNFVVATGSAL